MRPVQAFLSDVALNSVVLMLLGVSFWATWRGLSDFVSGQEDTGGLAGGFGFQALILVIVFALTLAMYVALRELFRVRGWGYLLRGPVAAALYALLAMWSVGFGYGFWWSLLAGQAASTRELEQAVTAFEVRAEALSARLSTAQVLMRDAAALSEAKAEQETRLGASCGVASGTGTGPLYRARMETRAQVSALADSVGSEWAVPLAASLAEARQGLRAVLVPVADAGPPGRAALEAAWAQAASTARRLEAEAQSKGTAYAAQLNAKADRLEIPPDPAGGGVAYCHDPDLARALRLAADALSEPAQGALPDWRWSGGQEGVARAVEDLWSRVFSLVSLKPVAPLDGRSLVALVAAIAVDLALLVMAFFQHAQASGGREGVREVKARRSVLIVPDRNPTRQNRPVTVTATAPSTLVPIEPVAVAIREDRSELVASEIAETVASLEALRLRAMNEGAAPFADDLEITIDKLKSTASRLRDTE
jgi:hypothetical protein